MILELLRPWTDTPLWNLFQYVTVRAALAAVIAFLTAVLLGPRVIAWLRARKVGENVDKTDSLQLAQLHQGKRGTPTMGGVLIVAALLFAILLAGDLRNLHVLLAVFGTLAFGLIGLMDDWIKLNHPGRPGLRAASKMGLLLLVSLALSIAVVMLSKRLGDLEPYALRLPFLKGTWLDLSAFGGAPYLLFAALVLVASANAVNLTDGLDGLATGCAVMAALAFAVLMYVVSRIDWAGYLLVPHVPGAAELTIVGTALAGSCLGFLWFNAYPAQVFMGDTGSLPIGGLLGFLAIVAKQELILPIVGFVFVVEAGSVILQVGSFKLRGKRIFRIAPLHHHFQFAGWHEVKVVTRFWIVAAICAIVGIATLKVR